MRGAMRVSKPYRRLDSRDQQFSAIATVVLSVLIRHENMGGGYKCMSCSF